MNKREAKRQVCEDAAVLIRAALNRNQCGDMTDAGGPDEERLTQAFEDLILELTRRGTSCPSPAAGATVVAR